MKTVFFESLRYKLITKNDFYYGSCPDIHITTPIPKRKISKMNVRRSNVVATYLKEQKALQNE